MTFDCTVLHKGTVFCDIEFLPNTLQQALYYAIHILLLQVLFTISYFSLNQKIAMRYCGKDISSQTFQNTNNSQLDMISKCTFIGGLSQYRRGR